MTATTTHSDATIRSPLIILSSGRNKFQRETLVVVNLQAKVAPSQIGANHLPTFEEEDGNSGGLNSPSEIKNNNNNNNQKDRP